MRGPCACRIGGIKLVVKKGGIIGESRWGRTWSKNGGVGGEGVLLDSQHSLTGFCTGFSVR